MIKGEFSTSVEVCSQGVANDARMFKIDLKPGYIKNYLFLTFFLFLGINLKAQLPDMVYMPNIACAQFTMYNDQTAMPVYFLNGNNQLDLEFDDMDGDTKSYYYTYVLCDYNWEPVDISPFSYLKGFTQQNITVYRYSSIAFAKYTHYQAILPDANTTILLSGNYMLKVFLDGDTSKLAFTKRLLVVDSKAAINAKVIQPLDGQLFNTHQKVQLSANINGVNTFSTAQQVKLVVLQNDRWDLASKDIPPTFVRGNDLEYLSDDRLVFPAGKEWRWLDLRNFILHSDRVDSIYHNNKRTEIFLKPDFDRTNQKYIYYNDLDGAFVIENTDNLNPYWQADFATVHFTFVSPDRKPYENKDIYLAGQLTGYELNNKTKMVFNEEKGIYEGTAFLKQGYYSYTYTAVDKNNPTQRYDLEGNYWETENNYTILMYYKAFEDRADQLIGYKKINSRTAGLGTGLRF